MDRKVEQEFCSCQIYVSSFPAFEVLLQNEEGRLDPSSNSTPPSLPHGWCARFGIQQMDSEVVPVRSHMLGALNTYHLLYSQSSLHMHSLPSLDSGIPSAGSTKLGLRMQLSMHQNVVAEEVPVPVQLGSRNPWRRKDPQQLVPVLVVEVVEEGGCCEDLEAMA